MDGAHLDGLESTLGMNEAGRGLDAGAPSRWLAGGVTRLMDWFEVRRRLPCIDWSDGRRMSDLKLGLDLADGFRNRFSTLLLPKKLEIPPDALREL
jgi:hypothetical protein